MLLFLLGWGLLLLGGLLPLGAFLLGGLLFLLRWPSNVISSRHLPTSCQLTVVVMVQLFCKAKNGQVSLFTSLVLQFPHLLQLLASGMS